MVSSRLRLPLSITRSPYLLFLPTDSDHKRDENFPLITGKFVRIAPDHISISSPLAIPIVYGHGTGFTKADFYDAFVSIRRGLFNTRDRKEHTRKRKIVSHVFSQVSPQVEAKFRLNRRVAVLHLCFLST